MLYLRFVQLITPLLIFVNTFNNVKISLTKIGDNPIDGSSNNINVGLTLMRAPLLTSACSPPDSVPAN